MHLNSENFCVDAEKRIRQNKTYLSKEKLNMLLDKMMNCFESTSIEGMSSIDIEREVFNHVCDSFDITKKEEKAELAVFFVQSLKLNESKNKTLNLSIIDSIKNEIKEWTKNALKF
jgi:hypothetical protein